MRWNICPHVDSRELEAIVRRMFGKLTNEASFKLLNYFLLNTYIIKILCSNSSFILLISVITYTKLLVLK